FAAATPSSVLSPHATSSLLSANKDMLSEANTLQQSTPFSPEEGMGPVYRPGDLHPITTALPTEVPDQWASNPTLKVPASDMNPLSFDAFDLPRDFTQSLPPEQWPGQSVPESPAPMRDMNPPSFDVFDLSQEFTQSLPSEQRSGQSVP